MLKTVTDDEEEQDYDSPRAGPTPSTTPGPAVDDDHEASYTPPSMDDGASVGTLERLGGGSATSTSGSEHDGPEHDTHAGPKPVSGSPRKLQPRAALPPRKAAPGSVPGAARPRPAMRGRAVTKAGADGVGVVI